MGSNIEGWLNNPIHKVNKKESFNKIDEYLPVAPTNILDIGCGLAVESEMFQKKYGSDLWLLDGDSSNNETKQTRTTDWGETADFAFYNQASSLKAYYDSRELNYTFVNINNIDIPTEVSFDLICSFKSCCFHYSISHYLDLIKTHSHASTTLIFDIRKNIMSKERQYFRILNKIYEGKKHVTAHIELT